MSDKDIPDTAKHPVVKKSREDVPEDDEVLPVVRSRREDDDQTEDEEGLLTKIGRHWSAIAVIGTIFAAGVVAVYYTNKVIKEWASDEIQDLTKSMDFTKSVAANVVNSEAFKTRVANKVTQVTGKSVDEYINLESTKELLRRRASDAARDAVEEKDERYVNKLIDKVIGDRRHREAITDRLLQDDRVRRLLVASIVRDPAFRNDMVNQLVADNRIARGLKGPPGDQGARGEQGDSGERGDQGKRGERGKRGQRGEDGEQGERGERGIRGIDGLCPSSCPCSKVLRPAKDGGVRRDADLDSEVRP